MSQYGTKSTHFLKNPKLTLTEWSKGKLSKYKPNPLLFWMPCLNMCLFKINQNGKSTMNRSEVLLKANVFVSVSSFKQLN